MNIYHFIDLSWDENHFHVLANTEEAIRLLKEDMIYEFLDERTCYIYP